MRKNNLFIIVFIFCFMYPVIAEPLILDVETAVELAVRNNLGIESSKIDVEIKKRVKDTVYNKFYPTLNAGATFSRMNEAPSKVSGIIPTNPNITNGTLLGNYGDTIYYSTTPDHTWNLSTSISANLTLTAQMFAGIRLAILDYESGVLALEKTRAAVIRDIRKIFHKLIFAEQEIQLMEESLESSRDRYEQTQAMYNSGLVDQQTVLSARVAVESLKPALSALTMQYETNFMNFKMILGFDFDEEISLQGSIEPEEVTLNEALLNYSNLSNRYDLQELKGYLDLLGAQKQLSEASFIPMLSLMFSMDPTFLKDPFKDPWFEDIEDDWTQRSGMFGVTVTVPIDPWIPNSSTWVDLKNKDAEIEQTRIRMAQTLQGAEMEVRSIILAIVSSQTALESSLASLELSERSFELAETAYNAGLKELLEVKDAEKQLRDARLSILKEKMNILMSLLDLEFALNSTLDEIKEIQ